MVPAHRCVGETALIDFLFSHEQLLADTWGKISQEKRAPYVWTNDLKLQKLEARTPPISPSFIFYVNS